MEAAEMGSLTEVKEILAGLKSNEGENHPAVKVLAPFIINYDVDGILSLLEKMRTVAKEN